MTLILQLLSLPRRSRRPGIPNKTMCKMILVLNFLLLHHNRSIIQEVHSGCWDNINNNNNNLNRNSPTVDAIPFWNIAARRQQKRRQQQQYHHQQQQHLLLTHLHNSNHTNNDEMVDYCMATTTTSTTTSQHYHQERQSQRDQLLPKRHKQQAVVHTKYRGGGAATSKTHAAATTTEDTVAVTNVTRVDEGYKPLIHDKKYPYHFSFFQNGDGSDNDIDGIPTRYIMMQNNDRIHAKSAVLHTLEWRQQHNIDTILQRPHVYYDIAKQVFPHYFVDIRDTIHNTIIFVQRPALLNLKLADRNHLTPTKLLEHYIYVNEYLWQILEGKDAMATMTSILDLHGLNLKYLRQTEIVNFMKEFVKTMDHHYPQRAHKTLIINAPKWFNILYKIVSPLLRESTKAKIEIHTRGKRQDKLLKALLGNGDKAEKVFPASFFTKKKDHKPKKDDRKKQMMMMKNRRGMQMEVDEEEVTTESLSSDGDETQNCSHHDDSIIIEEGEPILPSKFEIELREFTLARIKEAGVQMLEVVPL